MEATTTQSKMGSPSASIHQWQWEDSLHRWRRSVDESMYQRHWWTTGNSAIDARARTHIGEWCGAGRSVGEVVDTPSVVDGLVCRALEKGFWDLYVIEGQRDSATSVRRLRDQRGVSIDWLEGRRCPPPNTVVAMRVVELNPPGATVSTLPVVFGETDGANRVVAALLRAFGDARGDDWSAFMRDVGGRIILEYGIAHLQRCAAGDVGWRPEDDCNARLLLELDEVHRNLEEVIDNGAHVFDEPVELAGGGVAAVDDMAGGPHVVLFDSTVAYHRYYRGMASDVVAGGDEHLRCRIRRRCPRELSDAVCDRGLEAGLDPLSEGLVWLERRDAKGRRIDIEDDDLRAAIEACRMLATERHRRVA